MGNLSLQHLNDRFKKEGKKRIKIKLVDEHLEDEDLLEMMNAGLIAFILYGLTVGIVVMICLTAFPGTF